MSALTTQTGSLKVGGIAPHRPPSTQHAKLVKQSQKLVSQTFFGTMLKQMRNSPFKSKIFDGGRGGEAFSGMMDQHLADRMAGGHSGTKLVNSLVSHIEAKQRKAAGLKEEPKPRKKTASQALFERSGYFKKPARDGRKHVPADYRA